MQEKLSRPMRFQAAYEKRYAVIREQLFVCGPKGNVGTWSSGTRKQARELARKMARYDVRMDLSRLQGA